MREWHSRKLELPLYENRIESRKNKNKIFRYCTGGKADTKKTNKIKK